MITFLTLPGDFIATTTAWVGAVFTDIYLVIALAVGLPLAFWFIGRTIGLIKTNTR